MSIDYRSPVLTMIKSTSTRFKPLPVQSSSEAIRSNFLIKLNLESLERDQRNIVLAAVRKHVFITRNYSNRISSLRQYSIGKKNLPGLRNIQLNQTVYSF